VLNKPNVNDDLSKAARGSTEWRTKISEARQANWNLRKGRLALIEEKLHTDQKANLGNFAETVEKETTTITNQARIQGETILGTFPSGEPQDPRRNSGSYHIYVTNRRIVGVKIYAGSTPPKTVDELDSLQGGHKDFELLRTLIFRVTVRNAGKNRNLFAVQTRNGNALKILLRHSTDEELQKEKELLLEGFKRNI
jgi:hypothetical protein